MPPQGASGAPEAREARDVMAFGQEIGRVLSDGRVVGRAEPFAKVFPSSRLVKKAVGLAAWGVLEDIALDATLDERGRLVAETNVRRIAHHLGLNKDTVTRHLRRLREYGFVLQEEERSAGSGRYEACRYVLDPSACVERFTVTPTAQRNRSSHPCPKTSDTVARGPVSEETGHGGTGHGEVGQQHRDVVVPQDQQQQPRGDIDVGVRQRLSALGVTDRVADDLVGRYPAERLADVVAAAEAQSLRKPAGWVVSALRESWDVTEVLAEQQAADARQRRQAEQAATDRRSAQVERERRERSEQWAAAVSAALDDRQLIDALTHVATPTPGLNRRSVPLARAQLLAWAVAVHRDQPALPLPAALTAALDAAPAPVSGGSVGDLAAPPAALRPAADLSARIGACLDRLAQPAHAGASSSALPPTPQEQ